ncbi:acetyl esterase [Brevundimonas vesicularis]|uniref:alpha/beta hydrolase n=1 Tax=Brevundimonas vesicularis TaxID=41276 RepID=UPI0018EC7F9A|nr:alpha/beta hydrolase [Brevundimonas vesicularis]MDQ1193840.1 acetyl esterase [Brevundimonas vesicularis]
MSNDDLFSGTAISDETRIVNDAIVKAASQLPDWWDVGASAFRTLRAAGGAPFPPLVRSARARTLTIPGPAGPLALRIIPTENSHGLFLHVHGGGWVLGAVDQQDSLLERLADATGLTVVSVDYRLAPEYPFPAGPDDCEAAAVWLANNGEAALSGPLKAIGGESAGAHLAALTIIRLRDTHGLTPFRCANLGFGCYDLRLTPSARVFGDERLVLRTRDMQAFIDAFAPAPRDRAAPELSPLFADLSGLCPALFSVGTRDALLDDTLFMHARWRAAGNRAELSIAPGGAHGFVAFPGELATSALERMFAFLAEASRD